MELCDRLYEIGRDEVERAVNILKTADFNPRAERMPYLKERDLVPAILRNIEARGLQVMQEGALYPIRKEPLKRVYYGLRLLEDMPDEFMQALHDDDFANWMEMYFAAGAWDYKTYPGRARMPLRYEILSLPHFAGLYIAAGMDRLTRLYNSLKDGGVYSAEQPIPFQDRIKEGLREATAAASKRGLPTIEQILSGEKPKPATLAFDF